LMSGLFRGAFGGELAAGVGLEVVDAHGPGR
jgi:hypothetical protein